MFRIHHIFSGRMIVLFCLYNLFLCSLLLINDLKVIWTYSLIGFLACSLFYSFYCLIRAASRIPNTTEKLGNILTILGLLIGSVIIIYANVYLQIYLLRGNESFRGTTVTGNDFLYYSITTFTTTGYGDITSIGIIAKMTAASEMVVGYTLNTILMGLLATKLFQKIKNNG